MTTVAISSSTLTTDAESLATSSTPKRGGFHVEYGIYLVGVELDYNWNLVPVNPFQYATQSSNNKAFGTIDKNLNEAGNLKLS